MRWLLCVLGRHKWGGAFGLPYDPKKDGQKMTCSRCGKIRYYSALERRWITTTEDALYAFGGRPK